LVKELQTLALDIRVLNENGEKIDLATLGDDVIEPPNIVSDESEPVEDDTEVQAEPDEFEDDIIDEEAEPDDAEIFAAEAGSDDFYGDDLDAEF